MMRQTLQPSLIAGGSGRTILIAGGERGVIYSPAVGTGLSLAVWLKAQQYGVWPEVKRWAKEHPLAVPFVNQDTDMIHSIAQTGWTRWIVGDGKAYIKTDYIVSNKSGLDIAIKYKSGTVFDNTHTSGISYTDNGSTETGGFGVNLWSRNIYIGFGNYSRLSMEIEYNTIYSFHIDRGNFSAYNGKNTESGNISGKPYSLPLYLFAWSRKGSVTWYSNMCLRNADIIDNGQINHQFIPHRTASGECGMLDLVELKFYPNANTTGSFTIELTQDNQ